MGERGTDVAREAAALVLLDDSFASIVRAIRQGRRIYDNITKASRFVFAVHMPIIALALVPALLHWPVLLMPVHIVLLELLIDPACSIVFEAEPASDDLMQRPPRAPSDSPFAAANLGHAVIQGLGFAAILLVGYSLLLGQGVDAMQSRSAVFIALVLGVFLLTLANRHPSRPALRRDLAKNPWLPRMFGGVALMLVVVIGIPFFRGVMGLAIPDLTTLLAAVGMLLVATVWLELLRRATLRRHEATVHRADH
jgi:Ca2+-transporting ATPase